MTDQNAAKRVAGEAAAAMVEDGMRLGLGTGSTTAYAIAALGRRVREENLHIIGTPTSFAAERLAREYSIPLSTLDALDALDLAFDGADEVSPAFDLIKGRGAAHTREKVVASLAARFVVLIDPSKIVQQLGIKMPVPVEVLPMAVHPIQQTLERLGARPVLRMGKSKDGPVVTDQGFWILDAHFDGIDDPATLNQTLLAIPGVLDHGLFIQIATDVLVGKPDGTVRALQKEGAFSGG